MVYACLREGSLFVIERVLPSYKMLHTTIKLSVNLIAPAGELECGRNQGGVGQDFAPVPRWTEKIPIEVRDGLDDLIRPDWPLCPMMAFLDGIKPPRTTVGNVDEDSTCMRRWPIFTRDAHCCQYGCANFLASSLLDIWIKKLISTHIAREQ